MSASTSKLMEKVLDYTSLKNKVISKNIANSNTLNYKREDVENFINAHKLPSPQEALGYDS